MVDSIDLWILPTVNPDGFARGSEGRCLGGNYETGRYNEGRKDLNRDFPTVVDLAKLGTLWCQLKDTVLLIGTLLLFDPVVFPNYEA